LQRTFSEVDRHCPLFESFSPHIERALNSLFRRRLSVPELAGRVHALAGRLQLPLPTGRKRIDYLSWLD
jgi:hypothetical protein